MDADRLVFDFALVMGLLLLAPLLSARLRLPEIAGLIVAGMVVGEHGLGLFHLDITFRLLGKVGLLYLMFLAGLEINLADFQRYRKPGLVFGTLTFLIPQALGMVGARVLLRFTWPQSILLASMFASHTLIPFAAVQRFGLGRSRAATTAIGGTILTDTAALLVLAVIVRGAAGDGIGAAFWIRMALALAALVGGTLYLLPRLGEWFFRRAAPDGASEFIFVLAATFLVAYAAELAGLEPIIGAFLAGLALSPIVPGLGVLTSRLHFTGHALFIPFFLLSVGMRVDLRALVAGRDGWTVAAFMVGTVVATKWLAAHLSGRLLGYDRDETQLVFGLSVNQAAATLAAVLVGVQVGIFGEAVLNGAILMILVTCLIGPWFAERGARRLAAREDLRPGAPRRESGRILVPLAAPVHVDAIVDMAAVLRPDRCREAMYPLHVAGEGSGDRERVAGAERLLEGAAARAAAAAIPAIPLARLDSNVAGGILNAAAEFRADLILMGWQGRRRTLSLLQSIPERVITHSTQAVLIFHPGPPLATVKRLWMLAPPLIEHHPGLPDMVRLARRIASRSGAKLRLVALEATRNALAALPESGLGDAASAPAAPILWSDLLLDFERSLHPDDAALLLSVRRGNLAWQPSLERKPAEWVVRWPAATWMVLYPPIGPREPDAASSPDPEPDPRTDADRLAPRRVDLRSATLPDALRELLRATLSVPPGEQEGLAADLLRAGPTPLADGIVLLHATTSLVATPRLAVGRHPAGWAIAGIDTPSVDLGVLLSPRSGSPEQHLRNLAALARAARNGSLLPPS